MPIMISRTGFTGDLGYEIFMKNNVANKIIERDLESRCQSMGLRLMDTTL